MRRSLMAAAVAGVLALAGAVLVPGTAHATANLTCQGGFPGQSGTYNNVIVPSSANASNFCVLNGATVLGNVTVKRGGAILIANSSVAGSVVSSKAGTATGGNGLTFSVVMCGTSVGRNLFVRGSSSLVEIGTDDFGNNCVGQITHNTLNGRTNSVTRNQGGVEVEANQVNGNLTVSDNSGSIPLNRDNVDAVPNESTSVNNNSDSTHTLKCVGNTGIVDSSHNSFQSVVGQCHF